ncbi:hypothetical protein HHK36_000432 [Tetracentron sinense]|uniref:Uncharacterized protein n=1 Tax=Tetracentron sinense TaxID=13715 RepID=A0A835DPZ8_TETSI|nr:hypothetical protein HHK36_000432 [Tetracentron sinense]
MGEAENMSETSRMGMLANGDPPTELLRIPPLENGSLVSPGVPLKYKRRNISAVRDFPKGCGRFAPRINRMPSEDAVIVGATESSKARAESAVVVEPNPVKQLEIVDESETLELLKGSVQTEFSLEPPELSKGSGQTELPNLSTDLKPEILNPLVSSEQVTVVGPTEAVEPVAIELAEDLDQKELLDNSLKNSDKAELTDVLKSADQAEQMDVASSLRLQSPPQSPVLIADVTEQRISKKYPRRRRISATRDFPPFCGRNAPRLSKEECLKYLASSQKRSLDNKNSSVEHRPMEEELRADAKQIGEEIQNGDALKNKFKKNVPRETGDKGRVKSEWDVAKNMSEQVQVQTSPERKLKRVDTKEISIRPSQENSISRSEPKSRTVSKKVYSEGGRSEGKLGKDSLKQINNKSLKRKFPRESGDERGAMYQTQGEKSVGFEPLGSRVIVQALMAPQNCPWRQGKKGIKSNPTNGTGRNKGKKLELMVQDKSKSISQKKKDGAENSKENSSKKKLPPTGKDSYQGMGELVVRDEEDFPEHDEEYENVLLGQRSQEFDLSLIPFGLMTSSDKNDDSEAVVTRNKVRETLRLFQAIFRKLLQEEETKSKDQGSTLRRVDLHAAKLLKNKQKWVNIGKQILGPVPGVEVGDEFHYRVELAIVGLHRPFQGGIDYLRVGGKILATSIVASGGYADDMDNSDVLIYSGQGGTPMGGDKKPEDQKLERGNLSLKNSMDGGSPVRVIRGFKETRASDSMDARGKIVATYTYDGLYLVEKYWQQRGQYGTFVFKFQLRRIPGQPELALREVKKSNKSRIREGLCVDDISQGKEEMPICAVNTIDDEKPPLFSYITNVIYPEGYNPNPPRGCDCINGCSDSEKCSCAVKNGGEIPFNYNGAIVEAKPLIYECGPSCKCPPSCHNRVSQHSIKFQLEIFKTESRGWGVRSLTSIPSGSFICEYIGELLQDKEAEERTGNDEYLFDIGHNYNDHALWDGLSTLIPDLQSSSLCEVVEDVGFTIDAVQQGNVGRFINHSCSPNLYAQNVLYDHDDKRMPHIMFFAAENIPPLQELTYHYNYMIGQVRDSDGNIKEKSCYCGSLECTGRLY